MVDVVVYLNVDEKKAQQKLGWIGDRTAFYLKNAEKVAQATDGKVYIKNPRYSYEVPVLDEESGYYKLREKIKDLLVEAGAKALQEGKIAENVHYSRDSMEQKVPIIDVAELYEDIRKLYEDYEKEKREAKEREKRLKEQWEAFKASSAYALYNNYYKDYLPDISKECYEELYNKLKNEVLSEEELKRVIEELEELYEVAKFNKMGKELDELKKENKKLREELDELKEQIELLREFIAEKHDAEEFIEWLREKDEEEEEDPYREKAEELVPELFEDEEDDDY